MDREALSKLKRAELQKLAKRDSVKANGKTVDIIEGLLKKHYPLLVPYMDSIPPTSEREAISRKLFRRQGLIPMASGAIAVRRSPRKMAAEDPAPEAGPSEEVDSASRAPMGRPRSNAAPAVEHDEEQQSASTIQKGVGQVDDTAEVAVSSDKRPKDAEASNSGAPSGTVDASVQIDQSEVPTERDAVQGSVASGDGSQDMVIEDDEPSVAAFAANRLANLVGASASPADSLEDYEDVYQEMCSTASDLGNAGVVGQGVYDGQELSSFDDRASGSSPGYIHPESYKRYHASHEPQPASSDDMYAGPSGTRPGPQIFPHVLPPLTLGPYFRPPAVEESLPPSSMPSTPVQPRRAAVNRPKPYERPQSPRAPAIHRPKLSELRQTLEAVAPLADNNAGAQHKLYELNILVNALDERAARLREKTRRLQRLRLAMEQHFMAKVRSDPRIMKGTWTRPVEAENAADEEMEMDEVEEMTSREVYDSDLP
ncbi:hypothetical protein C8Q77DRAFT_1161604 [Trametes polyzona]|nr:hypothetical protein C8Q77DRAFT_1161604 [Trametes polyzona]